MADLDQDLLRTFIAIADAGSLTRAAHEVGRTQAALSMQVRRIEDIAGGAVLVRTPRGVELTGRGQRLLVHARRLARAYDEALADVTGSGLAGALRLGCPEDYCIAYLPAILRALAAEHPRVTLDVVCSATPGLQKLLDARQLDVALLSLALGDNRHAAVRYEQLVWVAAADYALPADGPVQLALSPPDTLDHQAARHALGAAGVPYRIAYASASKDGLLAIVRAGIAMAVLTRGAVPGDLRIVEPARCAPALPGIGIAVASASSSTAGSADGGEPLLAASVRRLVTEVLGSLRVDGQ